MILKKRTVSSEIVSFALYIDKIKYDSFKNRNVKNELIFFLYISRFMGTTYDKPSVRPKQVVRS
jgi:hypothetical protein